MGRRRRGPSERGNGTGECCTITTSTSAASGPSSRYAELVAQVRAAKQAGAPEHELRALARRLKELKQADYTRRKGRGASDKELRAVAALHAARGAYPQRDDVMLGDDGFAFAFPCPDGTPAGATCAPLIRAYFKSYGFVVLRGALDAAQCAATRAEVWDSLEAQNPGLRRGEASTYGGLSAQTYGLAPTPAVFTPRVVENRASPRVVSALSLLLGLDDEFADPERLGEGMLVSQDRWCMYRPTAGLEVEPGAGPREFPEWRTRGNLHLDLHPWSYRADATAIEDLTFDNLRDFSRETNLVSQAGGPHVQGVLALADNRPEDGGTLLVPGFHEAFDAWQEALGPEALHLDESGRRNWVVARAGGGGSYKFADDDPIHALASRVPLREGDFLVWDQRVVHGSQPNRSAAPRMAQFVKGFRRAAVSAQRRSRRAAVVARELRDAGLLDAQPALARRVFGLDDPPPILCDVTKQPMRAARTNGEPAGKRALEASRQAAAGDAK